MAGLFLPTASKCSEFLGRGNESIEMSCHSHAIKKFAHFDPFFSACQGRTSDHLGTVHDLGGRMLFNE
jgi:hypothetical protein